jgi:nitroreductase
MTTDVLQTIKRRRSCRVFLPTQIGKAELAAIVEAGQYAPHGSEEAWHFTVIQNAAIIEDLNRLAKQYAMTSGLPWLEDLGNNPDFHSVYHAPAVILVSAEEHGVCSEADAAAATQNLLLAAESLKIGSCWGYFVTQAFLTEDGKAMRDKLNIPHGYKVYTSVMLGYPAEQAPPPPERKPGTVTFI